MSCLLFVLSSLVIVLSCVSSVWLSIFVVILSCLVLFCDCLSVLYLFLHYRLCGVALSLGLGHGFYLSILSRPRCLFSSLSPGLVCCTAFAPILSLCLLLLPVGWYVLFCIRKPHYSCLVLSSLFPHSSFPPLSLFLAMSERIFRLALHGTEYVVTIVVSKTPDQPELENLTGIPHLIHPNPDHNPNP